MVVTAGPRPAAQIVVAALVALGCVGGSAPATASIQPGTEDRPREVNLIARDYTYAPDALDLGPGETVLLHVINGGLVVHEAIIGDASVQDAWEAAEAAFATAPPGPTPVVTVPDAVAGLRVVVASGERVDLTWTVPANAATDRLSWIVGCHIPGHWAKGMQTPIRWIPGLPEGSGPPPSGSAP